MTTSQPDALPAISDEVIPSADTEGCVCVVASYVTAASLLSAVTEDAARRIMMTPALGDFIELKFVSMGPEPGQSGDRFAAVRLITRNMLASDSDAGHSYFALVVAHRSAAEVERVLAECARYPFLAALPMRLHGIAAQEDRRYARDLAGRGQITVVAPSAWSHGYLVDEVRRYADELMHVFAASQEGLTQDQLDSLRTRYEEHAVGKKGGAALAHPVAAAPETPAPLSSPAVLRSPAVVPPSPDSPASAEQPETPAAAPPQQARAMSSPTVDAAPDVPGSADSEPVPVRPRLRRLLDNRGHRRKPAEPAAKTIAPRISGLAYLLVLGETIADGPAAWERSRASLLAVDQKIAGLRQAAYSVRLLQGDEEVLRGESRPAGQLSRRDVKGTVSDADFAGVLTEIRTMTRRDVARSGQPIERLAVVFFASEPPLADSVTAEVFAELAEEATVIWVIPKEVKALMSSAFTEPASVHVVEDGDGAVDDITDLLRGGLREFSRGVALISLTETVTSGSRLARPRPGHQRRQIIMPRCREDRPTPFIGRPESS